MKVRKLVIWMVATLIVGVSGAVYGLMKNDGSIVVTCLFDWFLLSLFALPFLVTSVEEWEDMANAL